MNGIMADVPKRIEKLEAEQAKPARSTAKKES